MSNLVSRVCSSQQERKVALSILYEHLDPDLRERQLLHILNQHERGTISLDRLILCQDGERVVGSQLCLLGQGKTMMFWLPRAIGEWTEDTGFSKDHAIENSLLTESVRWASENGIRIVQCLVADEEMHCKNLLQNNRFEHVTKLIYLQCDAHQAKDNVDRWENTPFQLEQFREELSDRFQEILALTYLDSQDCPEITGVRSMQETLDSHRSQGTFRADNWMIVTKDDKPAGILLLAGLEELSVLEIAYIGVTPNARGKGLGKLLVRLALSKAKEQGYDRVSLAMDERNQPALKMYSAEGFTEWDSKNAFLAILNRYDEEVSSIK